MNPWVQTIVTIVGSVFASSGLWAFVSMLIQHKHDKDEAEDQTNVALSNMVRGLAHAKIVEVGTRFLKKGYVTFDDLDEFNHYLYKPYEALGGNGYAKKIWEQVSKLPVVLDEPIVERKEEPHD